MEHETAIPKPKVFLSSFSAENAPQILGENDELAALRLEAWELGGRRDVWVAEHSERPLGELAVTDPLQVTDTLVERVMSVEHFVCVLAGARRGYLEHGMPIELVDGPSAVSHFEIELFQAALHGKTIHLFLLPGFSPGPRLETLLRLLSFALPDWTDQKPLPRKEILAKIGALLKPSAQLRNHASVTHALVGGFYRARGRSRTDSLLFLGGQFEQGRSKVEVNEQRIASLLDDYEKLPDMQRKLSRMWMAARELMPINYLPGGPAPDARFLVLWNRVIGAWGGAAAWTGLHAHLFVGVVAALNSQMLIRESLRSARTSDLNAGEVDPPFGGLGSAYLERKSHREAVGYRRCKGLLEYFPLR